MKAILLGSLLAVAVSAPAIEMPQPLRLEAPARATHAVTKKTHAKYATTVCMVVQSVCTRFPQYAGNFPDFDAGAQVSSSRCMARARELSQWCGNPIGVMTATTFSYPNGRGVSTSYYATGTSCTISQNQCMLVPDVVGSFLDLAPTVETNPARCMQRAREFSMACANPAGVPTTATFTGTNGAPVSNTYWPTGTSCVITQSQCANNAAQAGIFADAFDGSDSKRWRCFDRAREWAQACGNPRGSATTATFTEANGFAQDSTYYVP